MDQKLSAQSLLRFELFSSNENAGRMVAAYTTRQGGVSQIPYNSRNMGYNTQDERCAVLENIRLTASELGLEGRQRVLTQQVHGDKIAVMRRHEDLLKLEGSTLVDDLVFLEGYDGMVTDRLDLTLMTFYADCTSMMIYDPVHHVIGMAHSGWKGTVLKIGQKLVETMVSAFGSSPENLLCVVGPTALDCCYEVDEQVRTAIEGAGLPFLKHAKVVMGKAQRYLLNMETLNQEVLLGAGVLHQSIELSGRCTICQPDQFYSYRRDGEKTGRMSAVMALL